MATLEDIVKIAESFNESSIFYDHSRCTRSRHYSAQCNNCAQKCPSEAIKIQRKVTFDALKCVACGSCTVLCPTQAFVSLKYYEKKLYDQALATLKCRDDYIIMACERIASKYNLDPDAYVVVPCISYIHESLLLKLYAHKDIQKIYIVDGSCKSCKFRSHAALFKIVDHELKSLEASLHITIPVYRSSSFPEVFLKSYQNKGADNARRGFFQDTAGRVKKTASKAAEVALSEELKQFISDHYKDDEAFITESSSSIPTSMLRIQRHDDALNALYKLKGDHEGVISSRLFKSIEIDSEKCNACNICKVYCPTKAINIREIEPRHKMFEFYPCECIGCGLCKTACPLKCITVTDSLKTEELFSFSPLAWDIVLEY